LLLSAWVVPSTIATAEKYQFTEKVYGKSPNLYKNKISFIVQKKKDVWPMREVPKL
jgi:hypothetical protein